MIRSFTCFVLIACAFATGCGDKAKETMEKAAGAAQGAIPSISERATEALSSVEGGGDLVKNISSTFESLTTTLGGVKDEATANTALPDLGKISETVNGFSDTFAKLPAAAKGPLMSIVQSALGNLKPIVEQVLAIPGVGPILKPTLDGIMSKFDGMKA